MRVFLLDNYDSFTFNLVQALKVQGAAVSVTRNDQTTVAKVLAENPTHVVVSPGPGGPEDAGISMELTRAALQHCIPLLGVCLGHQALAACLGATVIPASSLLHRPQSTIHHPSSINHHPPSPSDPPRSFLSPEAGYFVHFAPEMDPFCNGNEMILFRK